ncbi:Hint domain-containing protein [Lichenicola sp.]|uniref:Hint domain-containing protein n=1 Tax=Lichenicola sp. TaxID=2804529 RepID=UPI003B00BBED
MDVTTYGASGSSGSAASNAGQTGGDGGPGSGAVAVAGSATDTENSATASGGQGGQGGDGLVPGSNAGAGGAAGTASASATTSVASTSLTEAFATATGGDGGGAGQPGSTGLGNSGTDGAASTGASAVDVNAEGGALASASGTGGDGGSSTPDDAFSTGIYLGGAHVGGNGAAATGTTASATGTTFADAAVRQTGGSGGSGTTGGNGAASSLTNAVSGSTTEAGTLTLTQLAFGGSGGQSKAEAGGTGGGASSSLTLNDATSATPSALVNADIEATAGSGGLGITGAALGGSATAAAGITGAGDLNIDVVATGGAGGAAGIASNGPDIGTYAGGRAGDGTTASATGTARTLSATGSVTLSVSALGGTGGAYEGFGIPNDGGNGGAPSGVSAFATGGIVADVSTDETGGDGGSSTGGRGGNGGSVSMVNAAGGTTIGGTLSLRQQVEGGNGGEGIPTPSYAYKPNVQGTGGDGGNASASLTLDDSQSTSQSQAIDVSETAYGGTGGGEGAGTGGTVTPYGHGGSAELAATISTGNSLESGAATSVTIDLDAHAGGGQFGGDASATGIGAAAQATIDSSAEARASTEIAGSATAVSQATALSGQVMASADTQLNAPAGHYANPITELDANASTSVAGLTVARAGASIGGVAGTDTTDQAVSDVVGTPASTPGGTDLSAGLVDLFDWDAGGTESAGATGTVTEESRLTANLDLTQLSLTGDLLIDLHQATLVGSGVTGVSLDIDVGSTSMHEQFTDPAAAVAFFTGNVIDLGPIDTLTTSTTFLSVSLDLRVTADPPGAGFFSDIELGASACYCPGTLILTEAGEMPIEQLAIGDRVLTAVGGVETIRWIGRRSYDSRFVAGRADILPVRIAAGALGQGRPRRDLLVSPQHAISLHGVLVPAVALINGVSITQPDLRDAVQYVHLELDRHQLIIAEGTPSESFVDDDSRGQFQNVAEFYGLYPDRHPVPAVYCAPRVADGPLLETIRREIDSRAGLAAPGSGEALRGYVDGIAGRVLRGWAQNPGRPDMPVCLEVLAGREVIGRVMADRFRADLRAAGLGSGCHAFELALPAGAARSVLEVRRATDAALLGRLSPAARRA